MRDRHENAPVRLIRRGWGRTIAYRFEQVIDGDSFTTRDGLTCEVIKDRLYHHNKDTGRSLKMAVTSEQIDGAWLFVMRFSE